MTQVASPPLAHQMPAAAFDEFQNSMWQDEMNQGANRAVVGRSDNWSGVLANVAAGLGLYNLNQPDLL